MITGFQTYRKHCAICHGRSGNGVSMAAWGMIPPPANFTSPESISRLNRDTMLLAIGKGKPGTAMMAWEGLLTEDEILSVIDYIRDALMPSMTQNDTVLGRKIYSNNCAMCHGDRGDVALWAQNGLIPPPPNFNTSSSREQLSENRMIFSVTYGRPDTAMPSWGGRLTEEEIKAVVNYIRRDILFPHGLPLNEYKNKLPYTYSPDSPIQADPEVEIHAPLPHGLVGDQKWGEVFYLAWCSPCHGDTGNGKGSRSDFIYPRPRNFTHPGIRNKANRPYLFEVVSKGIKATEMAAWETVLTPSEIANVVEHVFQEIIVPGLPPGMESSTDSSTIK